MYWKPKIRAELAEIAGISQSNLSEILHRKRGVSFDRADFLAQICEEYFSLNIPLLAWLKNKTTKHKAFYGKPLKRQK